MAVDFDAGSTPGVRIEGTTSQNWTHTPTGTPSAVAVLVGVDIGAGNVTSVTYGGESCTLAPDTVVNAYGAYAASIWGLANPPAGAQTVVVNLDAASYGWCAAISVTGSDTSQCFYDDGLSIAETTDTPGLDVPSEVDSLAVEVMVQLNTTSNPASGQTEFLDSISGSAYVNVAYVAGTSPTTPMAWALGASAALIHAAVAFKVASGGGVSISVPSGALTVGSSAPFQATFANQSVGPVSDITTGGWLPSSGSDLYAMLDEDPASDIDFIYSPQNPSTQQFEVKLGSLPDILVNYGHNIAINFQAVNEDTTFDMDLVQNTTVLDSWSVDIPAGGFVTRDHVLSPTVAASITDYTDLRVRGKARGPSGSGDAFQGDAFQGDAF